MQPKTEFRMDMTIGSHASVMDLPQKRFGFIHFRSHDKLNLGDLAQKRLISVEIRQSIGSPHGQLLRWPTKFQKWVLTNDNKAEPMYLQQFAASALRSSPTQFWDFSPLFRGKVHKGSA